MKNENELRYELIISSDKIISTNKSFDVNNLTLGDSYKPLDTFFRKADGTVIRRKYNKSENKISNQTLPRLACQIFENNLLSLSKYDRERFPICKYTATSAMIYGIFDSVEELQRARNSKSYEYLTYKSEHGFRFVMYSWNVFSTLIFVQECLKRFGEKGDQFILYYRDKSVAENEQLVEDEKKSNEEKKARGYLNPYSKILLESKNIIFRGAPGTGKTYLAKEIAADIVSDGLYDNYESLSNEQKEQIEFVQFHPSYDYSDFVEGLRPVKNDDGTMGFELQDGTFTRFVKKAQKNYEDALKDKEDLYQEMSAKEAISDFIKSIEFGKDEFKTISGNSFYITDANEKTIKLYNPNNISIKEISISISELRRMIESGKDFEKVSDVTSFFGKQFATQAYSYDFAIYKEIKKRKVKVQIKATPKEELKKYIFIIDEINRGEISKILGELFFSIDPGYRGKKGEVSTQYANMHEDDEKFYVPDNVYIIGTMNDIDRSVDSFDFAMRRRFRFIEIKADDQLGMLDKLENDELKEEIIRRMTALNNAIKNVEDLNEDYQIGASYFLKLSHMDFDDLWRDYLQPLLKDYIRGMYDEEKIMDDFARAYGIKRSVEGTVDESIED